MEMMLYDEYLDYLKIPSPIYLTPDLHGNKESLVEFYDQAYQGALACNVILHE